MWKMRGAMLGADRKIARTIFRSWIVFLVSVNMLGCFSPQKSNIIVSPSPTTAAEGFVYFADSAGTIHALQADGQALWQYSLADDLIDRQLGGIGDIRIDRLFARSDKKLFALARVETGAKTGSMILFKLEGNQLKWFKEAPQPEPNGSPIVIGDKALYLAANDGRLYAIARDDGRTLWQNQISQGRLGSPSLGSDGAIYITGSRHNLHAVDADGKLRWTVETNLR